MLLRGMSCLLIQVAAQGSGEVGTSSLLAPSSSTHCLAKCATYHAGASASSPMVCQYARSGTGTVEEMAESGVACFPPYNCGKDWNICYQDPNAEIKKVDAFAACDELDSLVQGGEGGAHPPEGGWQPTETGGWMKATGYPSCGWGSTYGHVKPGDGNAVESYGRVVFDGITTDRECCLKAAEFEGTPVGDGGAAIRFGVEDTYANGNKRCFVDREMMMKGNLDTSSGRSAQNLGTCGDDDHLFWRHAAGSADASNLKSGGRCVKEGRFTKVVGEGATLPMGRLPYSDSWELPNHSCDGDPNRCGKAIRYNSINDAEQCCQTCRELSWLGHTDVGGDDDRDGNPCLAWQIADGKCHILRKNVRCHARDGHRTLGLCSCAHAISGSPPPLPSTAHCPTYWMILPHDPLLPLSARPLGPAQWFDTKYGSDGLGNYPAGNSAMSIPEVIAACAGFADHDACSRADNSHGYWASCQKSGPGTPVEDDCDYFSFMYYRESAETDTGDKANATYRKIQVRARLRVLHHHPPPRSTSLPLFPFTHFCCSPHLTYAAHLTSAAQLTSAAHSHFTRLSAWTTRAKASTSQPTSSPLVTAAPSVGLRCSLARPASLPRPSSTARWATATVPPSRCFPMTHLTQPSPPPSPLSSMRRLHQRRSARLRSAAQGSSSSTAAQRSLRWRAPRAAAAG